MTNTNLINKNDLLANIEKTLLELKTIKEYNKNNSIDFLIKSAITLFTEYNDKGGFLRLLFVWDKNKGWSDNSIIKSEVMGYFNFIDFTIDFKVKTQKLLIDTDFTFDNIPSFLEYKKILSDNKKADKEKLNNELLKIKLPFNLDKLNKEELKAIILKANLKLKTLNNKK